jgi:REP element-mobilizing transposase RayT
MLVEIPPKMSVSSFMGFLKGKSSIMIYQRWGNMKELYVVLIGIIRASAMLVIMLC